MGFPRHSLRQRVFVGLSLAGPVAPIIISAYVRVCMSVGLSADCPVSSICTSVRGVPSNTRRRLSSDIVLHQHRARIGTAFSHFPLLPV